MLCMFFGRMTPIGLHQASHFLDFLGLKTPTLIQETTVAHSKKSVCCFGINAIKPLGQCNNSSLHTDSHYLQTVEVQCYDSSP